MALWDTFKNWFDKDNEQFIAFLLPVERTDDRPSPITIQAGKTYFRLRLASVFLHKRVQGGKSWYPAVHSLVRFNFGNQNAVDVPNVVDPKIAGEKPSGEVILRNVTLTSSMPFSGGIVSIAVGLVAMEEANHIGGFLKVFGSLAEQLVVPQLSAALNVAQPLANGIQELFGLGNGRLHLGLKQDFAAGELAQGYVVLIRATEDQVDRSQLCVAAGQLRKGGKPEDSKAFDEFDHIVLRVEILTERDDWQKLTFIDEPFQQALDALADGNDEESKKKGDLFLQTALRRVLRSPDLTQADRTRVIPLLKDQYRLAKDGLGIKGLAQQRANLQQMMKSAMTVDAALERPEPSLDDVVNF
ncbi:hypothetical protein [Bradyrhizobium sp.]|uniref:hypothetical protein n=1 Tax=Bradyrhizobium sp. TaxID=376 RepID=UPI003C20D3C5